MSVSYHHMFLCQSYSWFCCRYQITVFCSVFVVMRIILLLDKNIDAGLLMLIFWDVMDLWRYHVCKYQEHTYTLHHHAFMQNFSTPVLILDRKTVDKQIETDPKT